MPQDHPDWAEAQIVTIFTGNVSQGQTTTPLDITRYATLMVKIGNIGAINLPAITYQQLSADGSIIDSGLLSGDQSAGIFQFSIPVVGADIQFINNLTNGMAIEVVGLASTQPKMLMGQFYGADVRAASVANGTASGTTSRLICSLLDTNNINNTVTAFNGSVAIRFSITSLGGATQWTLYAAFIQEDGTRAFIPVTEMVAAGSKEMIIGHPNTFTSWWVINSGALTAGVTASLSILPCGQ